MKQGYLYTLFKCFSDALPPPPHKKKKIAAFHMYFYHLCCSCIQQFFLFSNPVLVAGRDSNLSYLIHGYILC